MSPQLRLSGSIEQALKEIKNASRVLRASPSSQRDQVLELLEAKLEKFESEIMRANQLDLSALEADQTPAFRDRLKLDPTRLKAIREGLKQVVNLPDPLGETVEHRTLKNDLDVRRVRSPLGVIFMIFESRPNVAIEAFSLGFKAGNALILRGGKESRNTVDVFYQLIQESLHEAGLPRECLIGIRDPDRGIVSELLTRKNQIDVVVPRGGEGLIQYVTENSQIPIIKNDRGLCHVYVHEDADLEMALNIVENAKVSRPGVCNSLETVLVHAAIYEKFLVQLASRIPQVRFFTCDRSFGILKRAHMNADYVENAKPNSYDTEYLDLMMNVKVVDTEEEAILHIEKHGSRHSECIVTKSAAIAERFQDEVDAAVVYWNASTRFTDGFELGLGGELGISTQKLHVRGPVGLRELTSVRWIIEGNGQIRK